MYSPILDTLEREAAAASTTEKSGGRSERTRQSEKEKFCIVKYILSNTTQISSGLVVMRGDSHQDVVSSNPSARYAIWVIFHICLL